MSSKYRAIWDVTAGRRLRYLAAIAALAVAVALSFLSPLLSGAVIDGVLRGELGPGSPMAILQAAWPQAPEVLRSKLWVAALLIVGVTALAGFFTYLKGRWTALAAESITRQLRDRLLDHVQQLPSAWHDNADTGDLVQRCSSDVDTVRTFLVQQVAEIGRALLLLGLAVPAMFWLDARMSLVALCLFPLIAVFAVLFFHRVQVLFLASDEAEAELTAVLQENLTGIRVVRAFGRSEFERERFAERNRRYRDKTFRLIRLLSFYWSCSDLLCLGQVGIVLVTGAFWIRSGQLSVGALVTFMAWVNLLVWPLRQAGRVLSESGKAIVSLGRIREVLDEPVERDERPLARLPDRWEGALEISDLRFAHAERQEVLRGLSLRVPAGQSMAIVGPPGAGKSTLVHLLLRLYEFDQGTIRVDGVEIREIPRRLARSLVSAVLQEPFLYSKTLKENIRFGRGIASHDEIEAAARAACIHDTICDFDRGYDTMVGERGVTLSGGQRQRVALARALLDDAPVLVLDDALSAVDTQTEARIREALRDRRGRRTTLLIAHRLSTVMAADRIAVLDAGRVVQEGTHAELSAVEGPYRALWTIQSMLEDELEQDLKTARGIARGAGG